jgi:hypothetical protein
VQRVVRVMHEVYDMIHDSIPYFRFFAFKPLRETGFISQMELNFNTTIVT